MKRFNHFCVRLFLSSMFFAASSEAADVRFAIDDAVKLAMTNNVDLQGASYRIKEASARVEQAGRLSNPEVETELEPNVRGREYSLRFGFSQRFPVTARLRLEKQLSRLHLKVAEAELNNFRRKLALDVYSAAVKLAALDERLRVHGEQLQNTIAIARTSAEAVKVGEASEIDAAQLELASERLRLQQAQIEMERVEANRELLSLLGTTNETSLTITGALREPEAISSNIVFDPAVEASYRARAEAAEEAVKLARASRWEDFSVGLFTGIDRREDLPAGLKTDHTVGVRLAVPVPLWNRGKGHVAEAEATVDRVENEAKAFRQRLANEAMLAQSLMESAAKTLTTIREQLLPKARQVEERLLALHKEGQTPFTETLRARERRFEIEATAIDALRDYNLARSRRMAATGTIIQQKP